MRRLLLLSLVACHHYTLPMTAGQLALDSSGPALVAYLGQPDASPAVCDLRARGPHVAAITPEVRKSLVDGLVSGEVEPVLWRRCIEHALPGMSIDDRASLIDSAMKAYRGLLGDDDLGASGKLVARVAAIQQLYTERPRAFDGHMAVLDPLFDELRRARPELPAAALGFADQLLATVDVEHGRWQGKPIDGALLDALAAAGNETTLQRIVRRVPDDQLRDAASRRIVRIRIALSAFDEVRAAAAAVEDAVIRQGNNRIALGDHAMLRAWFDDHVAPYRNVLVRQHVWEHSATLLGASQHLTVLPELSFRGSLWTELDGVSHPITLCKAKSALDPTPCIDVSDVTLDNPFAYLDTGCAFHFRDNVFEGEVVPLGQRDEFTVPVKIAGQPAVALHWGLVYERPADLAFGAVDGMRGQDLTVRVDRIGSHRYVYSVNGYTAVVEARDVPAFHVASQGAGGADGSSGSSGSDGTSGSECSSGGNGGDGGSGGDGGDGGDGGNVSVIIACGGQPCDVAAIERSITSIGGSGGSGGRGGSGGHGGSGGASRSERTHTDENGMTVVDDAGCSAGSSGSDGSSGRDGSSGSAGHPGEVAFQVIR